MTRQLLHPPEHRRPKLPKSAQPALWAAAGLGAMLAAVAIQPNAALAAPVQIGTNIYQYDFDINSGTVPPAGSPWWLRTVIGPKPGGNGVTIDLTGNLQDSREFITSVGFNLENEIQNLSWSCDSSDITCSATSVDQAYNQLPQNNFANGIQGLDLAINLPISNRNNRFQGTDTARFTINGTGLTPQDFLTTNNPGSPVTGVYSAARVQGIRAGSGSTTIADPISQAVPGPLPVLGAGVALGFSRRLRQRLNLAQTA